MSSQSIERRTAQLRSTVPTILRWIGVGAPPATEGIHDAEPPYTPRGCCAQAWSVAEVLRLMTVMGESKLLDQKLDVE
jgi:Amylo-alpha-1,6-glucosidase